MTKARARTVSAAATRSESIDTAEYFPVGVVVEAEQQQLLDEAPDLPVRGLDQASRRSCGAYSMP